jgi:hypothetical protein
VDSTRTVIGCVGTFVGKFQGFSTFVASYRFPLTRNLVDRGGVVHPLSTCNRRCRRTRRHIDRHRLAVTADGLEGPCLSVVS